MLRDEPEKSEGAGFDFCLCGTLCRSLFNRDNRGCLSRKMLLGDGLHDRTAHLLLGGMRTLSNFPAALPVSR